MTPFACLRRLVFLSPWFALGAVRLLAQGPIRPLALIETEYRMRAGKAISISLPIQSREFVRAAAKSRAPVARVDRAVKSDGAEKKGFVVGPGVNGEDLVLAASLLTEPGDYTVSFSITDENGNSRAAMAHITVDALPLVPSGDSTPPVVLLNGWQFSTFPPNSCPISATGPAATFGSLATQLIAPTIYFFDNCVEQAVNGSSIEALGMTLRQFLNGVQYSDGGLVPRWT